MAVHVQDHALSSDDPSSFNYDIYGFGESEVPAPVEAPVKKKRGRKPKNKNPDGAEEPKPAEKKPRGRKPRDKKPKEEKPPKEKKPHVPRKPKNRKPAVDGLEPQLSDEDRAHDVQVEQVEKKPRGRRQQADPNAKPIVRRRRQKSPVSCVECGELFYTLRELRAHEKIHKPQKVI